jgi:FkbM family methyltransferase
MNKIISILIKYVYILLENILDFINRKLVMRWRVRGIFNLCVDGVRFKMYSEADDIIVTKLFFGEKRYEYNELSLFIVFARKAKTILDIGANTGLYTILAGSVNKEVSIQAFEPYSANYDRFKKNTGINKLANVHLNTVAIGNYNGKVSFTVPDNNQICDTSSVDKSFTTYFYKNIFNYIQIEVDIMTLDAFVKQNQIKEIDIIKIDVENYERAVFEGARETLTGFSPVIFCEIFVDETKIKFFEEFLKPLGYYFYVIAQSNLIFTETLIANEFCRNYLFSKRKSKDLIIPLSAKDKIVEQLL